MLWPGHPHPPGPAGLPPPPGWGRVNTAAGSLGYLYQRPGTGPVPTAAPALPCPPQPAPSQRGTSRQGTCRRRSLHSAQRPLGALPGMPAASRGCTMPPFPENSTMNTHTPCGELKMPSKVMQNRNHTTAYTLKSPAHVWGHKTHATCSQTPSEAENTSPQDGHTHTDTHTLGRQRACWRHTLDTHTLSTPATRTPVTKCECRNSSPTNTGKCHTHALKQLMCKQHKTLPGNTPFAQTHKPTENTHISSQTHTQEQQRC